MKTALSSIEQTADLSVPMPKGYVARKSTLYQIAKRFFDIAFATFAAVFFAPIFLVTACAIKFEGPGPIFIGQIRIGRYGVPFIAMRFRTMHLSANFDMTLATQTRLRLRDDPRITNVGRFLRRTSIDELPALWNVFTGDMSIVGPRAAIPLEASRYSEGEKVRLEVRPGITGYWQVFGRNNLVGTQDSFEKMVEMDVEYIERQSFFMDLKILFQTVKIVLIGQAYY
jgi:lipopolysaccharide/colanic/teichoic acid biosynthesis glycosyltransferase